MEMNKPVYNPFIDEKDVPVSEYPLTVHEVGILARHWLDRHHDIWIYCCLHGQTGSSDLRLAGYVAPRFRMIERILGADAIEQIHREVEETLRKRVGDDVWQAYLEAKPIFGEDAPDEDNAVNKRVEDGGA